MDVDPIVLQNVILADVSNPLPDPNTFTQQAYDMAWPQILAFCSAILGIFALSLIIKSFTK